MTREKGYCTGDGGHAQLIVGWKAAKNGIPAHYIVRNHWSSNWGDKGYAYVESDVNCGNLLGAKGKPPSDIYQLVASPLD